MIRNKRGFSLIELLAVVTILGIISALSITAYTKYVKQAKEEKDKQNKLLIENAAKMYLNKNTDYRPREIGGTVKINLKTLIDNKYINENVINSAGKSCTDDSYIQITKNSDNTYSYDGYVICEGDSTSTEELSEEPKIVFSNLIKENDGDVNNVTFTMDIYGDNSNKSKILSYSYIISKKISGGEYQDVYSSGSIKGNNASKIQVKSRPLQEYVDVSKVTNIKVTLTVINDKNNKKIQDKEYKIEDTISPSCPKSDPGSKYSDFVSDPSIESVNWINKQYYDEHGGRTISVDCIDGGGSGCVRDRYSQSWPTNEKKETKEEDINISDNKGNPAKCKVKTYVDIVPPELKNIAAYNAKTGAQVTTPKSVTGGNVIINSTEYSNNVNGWLNSTNYPESVIYKLDIKDTYIKEYTWETNPKDTNSGPVTSNLNIERKNAKNGQITIKFNGDGMRYGKLTVYDEAGNTSSVEIYANIDRGAPLLPNISLNKYQSKTDSTIGSRYNTGSWSNYPVITRIENQKYDAISGWNKFEYQYKKSGGSYSANTTGERKDFTDNGIYAVKYRSCDNAGNCTAYKEVTDIRIDKTNPTCTYSGDSTTWTNNTRTIEYGCNDGNGQSGCKRESSGGSKSFTTTTMTYQMPQYTISDNAGNTVTCPARTANVYVDKTKPTCTLAGTSTTWTNSDRTVTYGCSDGTNQSGCKSGYTGGSRKYSSTTKTSNISSYTISDNAGNTVTCPARTVNVYVDKTKPTCTNSGDSTTWIKNNRTIYYGCSDGSNQSGCQSGYTGGSRTYTSTTKTANISEYTIKDVAGNTVTCPKRTANIYVDKTAPTCTHTNDQTNWTNSTRVVNYGCSDGSNQSGCNSNYSGGSRNFSTTTKNAQIERYTIKDKAGNETVCPARTAVVLVDKTKPSCSVVGASTTWTSSNRTISYGCNEGTNESGCKSGSAGVTKTYSSTIKTDTINSFTIQDNAGNSSTCSTKTVNVYVDKTKPTCTNSGDSTTWTKGDRTIKYGCSDGTNQSGCNGSYNGGSKKFTTSTTTSSIGSYTIKDNVGNTTKCSARTANVYVDKTAPSVDFNPNSGGYTTTAKITDKHSGVKAYHWKSDGSYTNVTVANEKSITNTEATSNGGNRALCVKDAVGNENCTSYKTYKEYSDSSTYDRYPFEWKKRPTNLRADTCSGDHRRYYYIQEIKCHCQKDKHTHNVKTTGHDNVNGHGKDEDNKPLAFIQYTSELRCKMAGKSEGNGHHLDNTYVQQVCTDGTSWQNISGSSNKYLVFHGYVFYRGASETVNPSNDFYTKKTYNGFDASDGYFWAHGGSILNTGDGEENKACLWACKK